MFHCMLQIWASYKKNRHQFIIFHEWNIISSEFRLFYIHSSLCIQAINLGQNIPALEGILRLESITRECLY